MADSLPKAPLRAFSVTHLAKNLLWAGEDAFAFYVLVMVLKLDPVLAGGLFLAGAAWNAVLDFAWGAVLAQRPELARRLPVIAAVAVPSACLSFALLPFAGMGNAGLAFALMLVFRTSFALFDVPHNGLSMPLARHYGHLQLMRLRSIAAGGGALVVAALALPLMLAGPSGLPAMLFVFLAALGLIGLAPLPGMLARLWQVRAEHVPDVALSGVARVAVCVLPFCLAQMLGAGALGAIGKGLLHLKVSAQWVLASAPLAIGFARLAVIPAWNALARRWGVMQGLAVAYSCIGLVILLLPLAVDAGPVGGLLAFALFGALVGGIALLAWTAFSQITAHDPAIRGTGETSLAYGLFTATTKIGLGASACFAGNWLESQAGRTAHAGAALWPLAVGTALMCLLCAVLTHAPARNRLRFSRV